VINGKLETEQAGIKKHIHFHVSRHSWATLALTRGVDIYTVSKIMGHSSVAITEIYANLINKKRDEVADIINLEITEHDIDKKNRRGK
jgi:site-specific recombinase XerD